VKVPTGPSKVKFDDKQEAANPEKTILEGSSSKPKQGQSTARSKTGRSGQPLTSNGRGKAKTQGKDKAKDRTGKGGGDETARRLVIIRPALSTKLGTGRNTNGDKDRRMLEYRTDSEVATKQSDDTPRTTVTIVHRPKTSGAVLDRVTMTVGKWLFS